jgi:hypothetical protein
MRLCKEAASERNVKVRILTSKDDRVEKIVREILQEQRQRELQKGQRQRRGIDIGYISPRLQTTTIVLIVNNEFSLSVEVKDDPKNTSFETIGLATCSNSNQRYILCFYF